MVTAPLLAIVVTSLCSGFVGGKGMRSQVFYHLDLIYLWYRLIACRAYTMYTPHPRQLICWGPPSAHFLFPVVGVVVRGDV